MRIMQSINEDDMGRDIFWVDSWKLWSEKCLLFKNMETFDNLCQLSYHLSTMVFDMGLIVYVIGMLFFLYIGTQGAFDWHTSPKYSWRTIQSSSLSGAPKVSFWINIYARIWGSENRRTGILLVFVNRYIKSLLIVIMHVYATYIFHHFLMQVQKLQAILKPMMLRRLKEDVEKKLAPKEETIIEVELTNIQKKYYRAILEKNFSFLSKGAGQTNVPNLVNTMMELRKCCNHPYLIKGSRKGLQRNLCFQQILMEK